MGDQHGNTNLMTEKFPFPFVLRLAISFGSMFMGWCCAMLTYTLPQIYIWHQQYVTDLEATVYRTALYGFIAWIVMGVPVISLLDHRLWCFRPRLSLLVGAIWGVLAYVVVMGHMGLWSPSWLGALLISSSGLFLSMVVVWGALAMFLYTLTVRSGQIQRISQRIRGLPMLIFCVPAVAVVLFSFVIWPAIERLFPAIAYAYGTASARNRVRERVLSSVKVGDRLEELRAQLPHMFRGEMTALSTSGSDFDYTIFFEAGKVVSVQKRAKSRP